MASDGPSTRNEQRRAVKRLRRQLRARQRTQAGGEINPLAMAPSAQRAEEAGQANPWRWNSGRLTFFNRRPGSRHDSPVVLFTPLATETLPAAFVSKMISDPPGTVSGAVYRNDGTIVPEFLAYDELTQHRRLRRQSARARTGADRGCRMD